MKKNSILCFCLCFVVLLLNAQEPPHGKTVYKNISKDFYATEVQLDSTFMNNVIQLLYDSCKCKYTNTNFYVRFFTRDSINYIVHIDQWDYPESAAKMFTQARGSYFWFVDIPAKLDLIVLKQSKQKFHDQHKELWMGNLMICDPPTYRFIYHATTKIMTVEKPQYVIKKKK